MVHPCQEDIVTPHLTGMESIGFVDSCRQLILQLALKKSRTCFQRYLGNSNPSTRCHDDRRMNLPGDLNLLLRSVLPSALPLPSTLHSEHPRASLSTATLEVSSIDPAPLRLVRSRRTTGSARESTSSHTSIDE